MSNPSDWLRNYHQNLSNPNLLPAFNGVSDPVPPSDATLVTTTAISDPSIVSAHLSPDRGRVSKPLRRRSRASRKTPTTLLNTDASNFRAMVQQFTGGPNASSALSSSFGPSNLGFGFGQARQPVNPFPITFPALTYLFHDQNQHRQNSNNQLNHSAAFYAFPPNFDGSQPAMGQFGGSSVDGISPESANTRRGITSFFDGGGNGPNGPSGDVR